MRVAITHYWLVRRRGGERVLEEIVSLFPEADIFTHVCDPASLGPALQGRRISETSIARLPFARRAYRHYLGFMPRALERIDLTPYELVISSESGPAQGVIAPPGARHLTYCHTPMRYLWDQYPAYRATMSWPARLVFDRVAHNVRLWDHAAAQRPDRIFANSAFVASRVRRDWGRAAEVIHPPVDLDRFRVRPGAPDPHAPYLFVSELVPYKRADLAIEAFRGLDRTLIVVGDGPEAERLERDAPRNVTFVGRLSDEALALTYSVARALIFPGEEDFGLTPLEAMAAGMPVIAYGRGGVRETVVDEETGLFFSEQTPEALRAAIGLFETRVFDPERCRARAAAFGQKRFRADFLQAVEALMAAAPDKAWR